MLKDPKLRLLIAVAAAVALVWFGWRLVVSDATRIRWLVQGAVEDLNAMQAGSLAGILAEDYVHQTSGAQRGLVRRYLTALFLRRQNRTPDGFRWPCRIEDGTLRIEVHETDPPSAGATARLAFRERGSGKDEPVWRVEVETELEERDGEWRIVRSRHRSLEGDAPF